MVEKLKTLFIQAFKFGIVGVISTLIDFGLLAIFVACGMYYMVAAALAFSISLIFNYLCSMRFVFKGRSDISKKREIIVFAILSIIGLGINELLLKIFYGNMGMNLMLAKAFATVFVMVWNFVSRKIFVEEHK